MDLVKSQYSANYQAKKFDDMCILKTWFDLE